MKLKPTVVLCAVLSTYMLLPTTVLASTEQRSQGEQLLDIPAGKLTDSLSLVSTRYQISIIADSEFISSFTNQAVKGRYTIEAVVKLLTESYPISIFATSAGIVLKEIESSQSSPSALQQKREIEKVIVLGHRLSSLNTTTDASWQSSYSDQVKQRKAQSAFISSITHLGLTSQPVSNLAEAFGHLSGITLSRDFGEGLSVSARGLGPAYQSTLLNGHPLAVNENVRDSGQSGRAFRFDVLPAQNLERIDILKSPIASIPEGGIGATVALQSMKPLQVSRNLTKVNIGAEYGEHSGQATTKANILTNWIHPNNKFGILTTLNSHGRQIRQDHFQTWNWEPNGNSYTLQNVPDRTLLPSNRMAITLENEYRRTNSLSLSLQWRPISTFSLRAEQFYSALNMDYVEQRWLMRLDQTLLPVTKLKIENNSLVTAQFADVTPRTALEYSKQQHINATSLFSLALTQAKWDIDVSFAKTRAISETKEPIRRTRIQTSPVAFTFSVAGGLSAKPTFYPAPFPYIDNTQAYFEHASARNIDLKDDGNSFRLFLYRELNSSFIRGLKTGIDWREKSRIYTRQDTIASATELSQVNIRPEFIDIATADNFLNAKLTNIIPSHWQVPNSRAHFVFSDALTFGPATTEDKERSYAVEEKVNGGFVSADLKLNTGILWQGEVGLRYQHWDNQVSGLFTNSSRSQSLFTQKISKQGFWLPNISLRAQLNDNWLIKSAIGKSIALPSYSDLQPGLSLNTTDGVLLASSGNPDLIPVSASQADIGVVWSKSKSNIYAGIFHRTVHDFIGVTPQQIKVDGLIYQLSRPENMSSTINIKGIEVDVQHKLPKGFGIQFNAMWLDNSANQIELVANWNYKLNAYFHTDTINASVVLDAQSDYLTERSAIHVPDTRIARQKYVSAHINYRLTDKITIGLTGRNLFPKPIVYYFEQGGKTLKEMEYLGSSFTFDLNITL